MPTDNRSTRYSYRFVERCKVDGEALEVEITCHRMMHPDQPDPWNVQIPTRHLVASRLTARREIPLVGTGSVTILRPTGLLKSDV